MELLGFNFCTGTWDAVGLLFSTAMWSWWGYLLYRVHRLKRAAASKTPAPASPGAPRPPDPDPGRVWDIGNDPKRATGPGRHS